MPDEEIKVKKNGVRRSLTVLGAGVAMSAVLLAFGTPAFAKSDMSMKVDQRTVRVGKSVRFSGHFGDDSGVNGDRVCLWKYVRNVPVKRVAPCVALRQRNGRPLKADSFDGYFCVTVKATATGRMTVVPVVDFAGFHTFAYRNAQIQIVARR